MGCYDMTVMHAPICDDIYKGDPIKEFHKVAEGFGWARLVSGAFLCFFALIFFIGILHHISVTADMFVLVTLVSIVIRVAHIYFCQVRMCKYPYQCEYEPSVAVDCVFGFFTLLSFYFCFIVNSYSYEMDEENNEKLSDF